MLNCKIYGVAEPAPGLNRKEQHIYLTWLQKRFRQDHLITQNGQPVSILSVGKRNETEGPDFFDCMILIDGEIRRGPIEIHLKNEDWYSHGHDKDIRYNNVILHVVAGGKQTLEIKNSIGDTVPVLFLEFPNDFEEISPKCNNWKDIHTDELKKVFQHYGKIRFNCKVKDIQAEILKINAEQLFYIRLCDALGYSHNRNSFKTLANLLPIRKIFDLVSKYKESEKLVIIESMLLGMSGFFDNAEYIHRIPENEYTKGLKSYWDKIKDNFDGVKTFPDFRFGGSRPQNSPVRRILSLGQILAKFFPAMPGQAWIQQVAGGKDYQHCYEWTKVHFQQPGGLWRNHPLLSGKSNVLIGNDRLNDLITNLLIPFAAAIGNLDKNNKISQIAQNMNSQVNFGAIPGRIKKVFVQIGFDPKLLASNEELQGAIEFDKSFCQQKLCQICPLEEYAING